MRDDVAEAEGEESGAADVDICAEVCDVAGALSHHEIAEGGVHREIKQGKAEDEENRPYQQQHKEREGAIDAVDLLADLGVAGSASEGRPWGPGGDDEEASDLEVSGGPAWQDDGLEGVEGDSQAAEQTEDEGENVHEKIFSF